MVPHSDSSHKHILTRHTENKDFQVKRVIQTSSPKGVTLKNRKKPKNYELLTSLANNFHLYKTKQSNFKRKKQPLNIYKNSTRHLYDMYLNSTTVDLFWLKGILETQSMHIYIYTYIKGCEVVKCCKHMLFAFSRGYDFSLVCIIRSQCSHFYSPITASLQLSFWLLCSGCYIVAGESTHG